ALELHVGRHRQRARREVQDGPDAGAGHLVDDLLGRRGRHRDDGDADALGPHDLLQLPDVVNGHAAARDVPDLLVEHVEERDDLEAFLPEARVIRQGEAQVPGAHDRDLQLAVEAEDLAQVAAEVLDVVAHAAHAELAEVRQILADLRGVQLELRRQLLRGDRLHRGGVELRQAAQIDREAVGRELRDLFGQRARLVRLFHNLTELYGQTTVQATIRGAARLAARRDPALESAPMAHVASPEPQPPATGRFEPYVPASQSVAEFTVRAILLGALFGLIFGASTVYLGLRAGLTVSASIPIAVLAI